MPFQSVNILPSIKTIDNRSPQVLAVNSGATFGSGKIGSNNGSSSGGSVFSGVGNKSGNGKWTLGIKGDESQGKTNFDGTSGSRGLMLNKIRSGSSMGGSFL